MPRYGVGYRNKGASRRYRSRMTRMKRSKRAVGQKKVYKMIKNIVGIPETKYVAYTVRRSTPLQFNLKFVNMKDEVNLPAQTWDKAFAVPGEGTGDNARIGNHIKIKKLWIRLHWEFEAEFQCMDDIHYRIIIFNGLKDPNNSNAITGFFRYSNGLSNVTGNTVDHRQHDVFYDRTFKLTTTGAGYYGPATPSSGTANNLPYRMSKIHDINLRLRGKQKHLTFEEDGEVKDEEQKRLFITCFAYTPSQAQQCFLGTVQAHSILYYNDV